MLQTAYAQCEAAIEAQEHEWPKGICNFAIRPRPFAVLWPVGSRREEQRLVMYEVLGERMVMTLEQFKRVYVEGRAADGQAA